MFESTDWQMLGELCGSTLYGRHIAYDEFGHARCRFALLADEPTTYTLTESQGMAQYVAREEVGGPSFYPAYDPDERPYSPSIAIRQGWQVMPRYLADGRPGVFKLGGSEDSPNRPAEPRFADPADVAALDRLVSAYEDSLPRCSPPMDLYRICEGDNPSLLRSEPVR